jgi:hypothetical protein
MQNRLPTALPQSSQINKIARETGWLTRKRKILSPTVFVKALLSCVSCGHRSLREIAIEIGLLTEGTISKQALSERFNSKGVKFLKQIVVESLRSSLRSLPTHRLDQLSKIKRILIGDSSSISMHSSLVEDFPGSTNNSEEAKSAQLKFQFTFDLLSGQWLQADLGPYLIPDQAAAPDIFPTVLQPGDLIIRDLGYATLDSFDTIGEMGAFYISRLPHGATLLARSGECLDLYRLASDCAKRPGDTFSMDILLGAKKKLACRLVIIRVPKHVANERRRRLKATAKRKGRSEPKKAYLAQQDWSFYITNLSEAQAGNAQLFELYQLRWRVENIFRISKSQTGLVKIAGHKTNAHHVQMLLWAWMLLMISMGRYGVFRLLELPAGGADPEIITASIFKSIERIFQLIAPSIELAAAGDIITLLERLSAQQAYHDRYEKRSRISMPQRVARALQIELPQS